MSYEIFWGPPTPEEIHGINLLPVSSTSLYLARYFNSMPRFYEYMLQMIGGQERLWQDIIWSWQSMFDAQSAWTKFNSIPYTPEPGTTYVN
jgi:endoglucanase Acf2